MPSTRAAAMSDLAASVEEAVIALGDALDIARADDPSSIERVLARVAVLREETRRHDLGPERYPELRARLDRTMAQFQRLIDDVTLVRNDVGRELASVRRRRKEADIGKSATGGSRIDLTR